MDIGGFVPILLFILWAVLASAGRKKKGQPPFHSPVEHKEKREQKTPPEKKPVFKKIEETLQTVLQELEPHMTDDFPQTLPEVKKADIKKQPDLRKKPLSPVKETYRKQKEPADALQPKKENVAADDLTRKTAGVSIGIPIQENTIPCVKDLQKAVIWSELLAKPVSLRDED